ncbi:MAG TPA: hypothetical protein VIK51_11185 [Vicinamibacteria bacterium]
MRAARGESTTRTGEWRPRRRWPDEGWLRRRRRVRAAECTPAAWPSRKTHGPFVSSSVTVPRRSARKPRGLEVFLGYASGVGKSFRMLDEGRRRRMRGEDVVVAAVQPSASPSVEDGQPARGLTAPAFSPRPSP